MASLTVRRLSAFSRSQILRPNSTTTIIPRYFALKPLSNNQRSIITQCAPVTSHLTTRRYATPAPASAEEDPETQHRERLPGVEPSNRRSYLETLRSGDPLNWIPAHWVTTIYKVLFGAKRAASPEDALLLLRCFDVRLAEETPENRVKMAEKAWQDLKAAGTALDIRHYNALLGVYLSNHHAFDPEDFLMILSEDGVAMDKESYLLFVKRYCQTGNMTDAMRILEFMKSKGMKINRPLFHALISGHLLSGDVAGAQNLQKMMNEAYQRQPEDYLPIIETYARMGNVEKVLESFIEMKSQSLTPDVGHVLSVLTAYVDWCLANNKYPESSALDSFYDILQGAIPMTGLMSIVCQHVVKLQTNGFHDISADVLAKFPDCQMASRQFFKRAVRTLPFTDVLRYCESVRKANESDPMTEYCLPEIRLLPFNLLQQVLIDAKESEFPVETISDIVLSKFPDSPSDSIDPYFVEKKSRSRGFAGPTVEQAGLLAMQLELPVVKDLDFWATKAFSIGVPFYSFYTNILKAGSKHDESMIEEYKPLMVQGYLQYIMSTTGLDRVKIAANLLRAEPELELRQINTREFKQSVIFRLQHHQQPKSLLPDAFYLLERCGELTRDSVGFLLKRLSSRNPDPKLIASVIDLARAENVLPRPGLLGIALNQTTKPDVQAVLLEALDSYKKDYLENSVLEKMTLQELQEYENKKTGILISSVICKRACAEGNESAALDALSKVRAEAKSKCLVDVIDMYVNTLGDGFKALEYVDALLANSTSDNVELPTSTFLRLIEILLRNGRSLSDLHVLDDLAQSRIKLISPFADQDRGVISNHVTFISSLESEERAAIDAYMIRLMASNLGASLTDFYVASVVKRDGVKEALELVKSYFNADHSPVKGSIPDEEALLDAIVASEDVLILKEFLDLSYVVNGERNAFLNLAFALYKGGKYVQGKRILNVPGLRSDDGMVTSYCERMLREKRYDALEAFCGDVCCIYGVDKADLSFFKLRAMMAKGDNVRALEYYNDLLGSNEPSNEQLKQQAAFLYESLNLQYFDQDVVAVDYNGGVDSKESPSYFDGNISEVLRNVGSGAEYPLEFYTHLIGSVLADDPSHVYVALIEGKDTSTLEQLDGLNSSAHPFLAMAYIRANRIEDLLQKCRQADKPEEYLTILNLQLIRTKIDRIEWISKIEELAEEKESADLISNLVNYHLSVSDEEAAKALLKKHPEVEGFSLLFVNTFSVLESITKMETTSENIKGSAFYRLIFNGTMMNVPFLVKHSIDQLLESGIDFHVSAMLRKRVTKVLGKDPFMTKQKKVQAESYEVPVEDVLGLVAEAGVVDESLTDFADF